MAKYVCLYCDSKFKASPWKPKCPTCKDTNLKQISEDSVKTDIFGYNKDPIPPEKTTDIYINYGDNND